MNVRHSPLGSCVGNYGCTRPECLRAAKRASMAREKLYARGETVRVDAARAAAHVATLTDAGVPVDAIQRAASISSSTMQRVRRGAGTRIHRDVERRVLAVSIDPTVDATVARRQLRALAALGYPYTDLARALRWWDWALTDVPDRIPVGAERILTRLVRRIGDTPGPSERTRAHARRQGWLVPAWYDEDWAEPDDTLAAEAARLIQTGDARRTRAARAAVACQMYQDGETITNIAAELRRRFGAFGSSERAVHRYVREAGLTGRKYRTG